MIHKFHGTVIPPRSTVREPTSIINFWLELQKGKAFDLMETTLLLIFMPPPLKQEPKQNCRERIDQSGGPLQRLWLTRGTEGPSKFCTDLSKAKFNNNLIQARLNKRGKLGASSYSSSASRRSCRLRVCSKTSPP